MTSREEFMRSLGISTDDVTDPAAVKTRYPSKALTSSSSKSVDGDDDDGPLVHRTPSTLQQQQQATRTNPGSSMSSSSGTPMMKRDYSTPVVVSSRNSNASPVFQTEKENAGVTRSKATAPAAAPSGNKSAREQFLRSLGIDNMDTPETGGAISNSPPAPPPRASQEYLKSKVVPGAAAAAMASQDSEEEYGGSSFRPPAQPDLTLGHRRSSSKMSSSFSSEPAPTNANASAPQPVSSEHDGWSVDQLKNEGNKSFEEGDFRKAIRLYTKGIDRDPTNSALYSNRSASYLQAAKQMGIDTRTMALRDADKVIELRPDWFKGYSRRGDALFKFERYSEAAVAYERALALDPENMNLLHSLGEARNAAGNISSQKRTTAWSTAPQSVENLSAKKSSHELLEEMKRSMHTEAKECILVGNDFREAELQRYREMKAQQQQQSRTKSSIYSSTTSSTASSSSTQPRDPSQPQLNRSMISEEFSSDAAAAYQKALLEQYRAKKAAQQQNELSKYM